MKNILTLLSCLVLLCSGLAFAQYNDITSQPIDNNLAIICLLPAAGLETP